MWASARGEPWMGAVKQPCGVLLRSRPTLTPRAKKWEGQEAGSLWAGPTGPCLVTRESLTNHGGDCFKSLKLATNDWICRGEG